MKVVINDKEYKLRFGMGCWERFQQFTIDQDKKPLKGSAIVIGYCNLVLAAIGNANDRLEEDQELDRDALYDWIDENGVTDEGNAVLLKIQSEFEKTLQYKTFLELSQKKTISQATP